MKIAAMFKWLTVVALVNFTLQAQTEETMQTSAKTTYLVVYKRGPAWVGTKLSEQSLQEHGKYLLDLYEKGSLKFAGPFLDDAGGAVVLEAEDEANVKVLVANDPAVKQGTFVSEIHPWALQPWEVHLQQRRERQGKAP